ncbi:MAG: TIGR02147 family protein [Oligoflexia bacterium]|nr:TIGR02147 family protein [Oligoflexia bacterium]
MKIYDFENYKDFVNSWINAKPNNGRGIYNKIAQFLNVHSTMVSHVFKGDAHFSLEQSYSLCDYLRLNEEESDYFLRLVQYSKAATPKLKEKFSKDIASIQREKNKIVNYVKGKTALNEEQNATYYSSWFYSAIKLLATMEKFQDIDKIAQIVDLPPSVFNHATQFLVTLGLISIEGNKLISSDFRVHLDPSSPFIWEMHQNWRIKAFDRHHKLREDELMFSAPLTIAKKDIVEVRKKILKLIEEVSSTIEGTEPDTLALINIDWVELI